MKYAIRTENGKFLPNRFTIGWCPTIQPDALFDSISDALSMLERRAARYGHTCNGKEIVGIEETSGGTTREIVELEGLVDLRGLKYAITATDAAGGASFIKVDGRGWRMRWLEVATLWDTLGALIEYYGRSTLYENQVLHNPRIVGVREVPSEPTYRVVELEGAQR